MARIRTLKPEFWSDEKMAPLPPITRLVFLGLVSMADDAGRLVDSVKQLDGLLFPATDDTCADALQQLASLGRILRYRSASGQALIQIVHWEKHQRVEHPSKYNLPAPPAHPDPTSSRGPHEAGAESSRDPHEGLARPSRLDLGPTTYDLRSTSNDQRPTSASSSARVRARERAADADKLTGQLRERFPRVSDAIPPDDDGDLLVVLARRLADAGAYRAYVAEMGSALDGLHGPPLTPAELRQGLVDWLANDERPNLRRFRGYLRGVVPDDRGRPPPRDGKLSVAEKSLRNTAIALGLDPAPPPPSRHHRPP